MLLSPPRPVPLETNPDSDGEPPVPPKSVLNLPDEMIPSSRGIPLHTRYTRRNQIQVAHFRKLVFGEVLSNLHVRLNPDVMNVIELYTFEHTHPIVPHERKEHRRSLFREGDILDLLRPCEHEANQSICEDDYTMHCLIGRVLYGFDIHDSPYSTIDDPNPCEIMTNEGGVYLVPNQMSDWFLYKDGECVALPVLYRYKHCITDARIISRSSGPFLRLELKPVHGLVPRTDSLLHGTVFDSQIKDDDSDQESFTSCDIDPNLLNNAKYVRSAAEDSLAAEITKSWSSTRESVLVVVSPPALEVEDVEESCNQFHSVFSAAIIDDSDSEFPTQVEGPLESDEEEDLESVKESNEKNADGDKPPDVPRGEFPKELVPSFTTTGGLSFTSLGSAHFQSETGDTDSESEDRNGHFSFPAKNKMMMRQSIITDTDINASIILELGAGVIGIPDLSLSYLHTIATPNPYNCCCHGSHSGLESMEL